MDPSEKQAAKYKSKNLMGYIQDKVDVGMTKLRSDEGVALDVAILKATIQDDVVPKEKHVVTLKIGCAATAPRQQVNYVIHGLAKRLEEKQGWIVTLKTLIVFHRLLREVDPSFQEEIIKYQDRTGAHRMLRLDGFADHTTKDTWDYSAWIRVYSIYLDERLGVFKSMRFDPELAGHSTNAADQAHAASRDLLETCGTAELLEKLPMIQKLLVRLVACVPEGAAQNNEIILQSCILVLKELRATYATVCKGIINLADKFFEMERSDALRALDAYKENVVLNEKLNTFLSAINNVPALRGAVQMPQLQSLPGDFLTTMEEYVKDAPKVLDASAASRGNASAGATGGLRSSTVLRQSGATSANLTGTGTGTQPAATTAAPTQGVLKIGPPTSAPAPVTPPEVDLLGDDFAATTISPGAGPVPSPGSAAAAAPPPALPQPSPAGMAPPGYGQFPPQQPAPPQPYPGASPVRPPGGGFGFEEHAAFGAPAPMPAPMAGPTGAMPPTAGPTGAMPYGMPPPAGMPQPGMPYGAPQPQGGFNPFAPPQQQTSPPQPGMPQAPGFGSPPQASQVAANPFGAPAPAHAPNPFVQIPAAPANPFGPGAYGQPAPSPVGGANPFAPTPGYGAPSPGGYMQSAPPTPTPANPFGAGGAPAWGAGPPQGAAAWGTNVIPGTTALRKSADPLNAIGVDLFGNQKQPVQQSLREMKHGQ